MHVYLLEKHLQCPWVEDDPHAITVSFNFGTKLLICTLKAYS